MLTRLEYYKKIADSTFFDWENDSNLLVLKMKSSEKMYIDYFNYVLARVGEYVGSKRRKEKNYYYLR